MSARETLSLSLSRPPHLLSRRQQTHDPYKIIISIETLIWHVGTFNDIFNEFKHRARKEMEIKDHCMYWFPNNAGKRLSKIMRCRIMRCFVISILKDLVINVNKYKDGKFSVVTCTICSLCIVKPCLAVPGWRNTLMIFYVKLSYAISEYHITVLISDSFYIFGGVKFYHIHSGHS